MHVDGSAKHRDERLGGANATAFIAGAIVLSRGHRSTPELFDAAVRAIDAAYVENPVLAAPTLAVDLERLVSGEGLGSGIVIEHERLRDAHRRYEDHVLARLLSDARWSLVAEAMGAVPRQLRAAAVGLMTARLHQKLLATRGVTLSSAIIRRMRGRLATDIVEVGQDAVVDPLIANRLADGFEELARGGRSTRELIGDADIFLIENIGELKQLSSRVALDQLATASQRIDEKLPRRMRGRSQRGGDALTALASESVLPAGGFAAISTQGVFENLLQSELAYLERSNSNRPDLFDLRFVENELLYFWRDESVDIRRRKTVVFAIDHSLTRARVVDSGDDFQRIVWVLGTIASTVRKLSAWMDREALAFEVLLEQGERASGNDADLVDEVNAFSLLLRDFRERRQLRIERSMSLDPSICDDRDQTKVIWVTSNASEHADLMSWVDAVLDCSAIAPAIRWKNPQYVAKHRLPAGGDTPVTTWSAIAWNLLDGMLNTW